MTTRLIATAIALTLSTGAAFAQSYNAPAGIPAAVAPGGLEGRAALYNLTEDRPSYGRAIRNDDLSTGSVRARRPVTDRYGR